MRDRIFEDEDPLGPLPYALACALGVIVGALYYLVKWARDRLLTPVVE